MQHVFIPGGAGPDAKRGILTGVLFTHVHTSFTHALIPHILADAVSNTSGGGWELHLQMSFGQERHQCQVRAVRAGDEAGMVQFGRQGLSDASRGKFAPFVWDSPELSSEFTKTIAKSTSKQDLHYVAEANGAIVAHAFLWSAQDEVPELGIAVADAWHGRGLGPALLLLLEVVAKREGRKALELTTMQNNEREYPVSKN